MASGLVELPAENTFWGNKLGKAQDNLNNNVMGHNKNGTPLHPWPRSPPIEGEEKGNDASEGLGEEESDHEDEEYNEDGDGSNEGNVNNPDDTNKEEAPNDNFSSQESNSDEEENPYLLSFAPKNKKQYVWYDLLDGQHSKKVCNAINLLFKNIPETESQNFSRIKKRDCKGKAKILTVSQFAKKNGTPTKY